MGSSLSVKLCYGIHIGGYDGKWLFEGYDEAEYEMRWPDWVGASEDFGDEDFDFIDAAQSRLKEADLGKVIDFELAGVLAWDAGTGWVLVVKETVHSGAFATIELDLERWHMGKLERPIEWNDWIREALRVLELTPKNAEPKWIAVASYG